ncbi:hypothetical protein GBAR_LOCUS971 [Geodia barretti]|uniref:Uncharacterized protein n=1 Tax=Geodia barretti TaxID=519541 RepID=A0AA35QVD8_GEOBA|nr:hypothetical protein GBAR_LOCUS971 [Geodia barretti]
MDEPLTEDRAAEIAEWLLPVQTNTMCLGITLTLQPTEVEAIHMRYPEPRDRLLQIVIQFLRQANPRWRLIIDALRSRLVNFPGLARRLEEYIVQPVVVVNNHVVVPQPLCAVGNDHGVFAMRSIQSMQQNIASLRNKFDVLKNHIRQCLEMRRIPVERVADALTTLSPDREEQQRLFLESHVSVLFRSGTHYELFGFMNFHWDYLNTPVMENLAQKFDLEEVRVEMESYKSELRQFRQATPLALFAQAHTRRHVDPPPHFRSLVIEFFGWPENATLQDVEVFRKIYASRYNLHECAMMLAHVRSGSFIITWFIPESVVKKLSAKVPRVILKKFSATKLAIAGTCVYQLRKEKVSLIPSLSSVAANEIADTGACQLKGEDYPFVAAAT